MAQLPRTPCTSQICVQRTEFNPKQGQERATEQLLWGDWLALA